MSNVTDWNKLTPASAVLPRRNQITLPAFTYDGFTWKGASEIIVQYNFTASKNFVIPVISGLKPTSPNYCLCVRYRVGDSVYRYKLWQGVGENLNVPLYNGELIKKNFVLEVWNIETSTTVSQDSVISIVNSILTYPTDLRTRNNIDLANTEIVPLSSLLTPAVNPTDYTDDLVAKYDAGVNVTTGGIFATAWADQNNANSLAKAGANNPTYTADAGAAFNNQPTVNFYGSQADLSLAAHPDAASVKEVVVALKINGPAVGADYLFNSLLGANAVLNGDNLQLDFNTDSGVFDTTLQGVYPEAQDRQDGTRLIVISFNRSTGLMNFYSDGGQLLYSTTVASVSTGSAIVLGNQGLDALDYSLFEFRFYSETFTDAQRAQLVNYLFSVYKETPMTIPLAFNDGEASQWLDNS